MADRYAVIGNPVTHSKSPRIHAEFARQTGQDISYTAIPAADDAFESTVELFRAEGGLGMNVTLPFKHRAFALAGKRSPRAEHARAANTLAFAGGAIFADNTDGYGLVRDLTVNLGCTLRGRRILVLGAGGAAYGVCGPLLDETPAALVVANRTTAKAQALCEHLRSVTRTGEAVSAISYEGLAGRQFDVVVNATSAGLADEMPPLPPGIFAPGAMAYDMLYGRSTPFLQFAKAQRTATADGLGMLVEQAAESFLLWRGIRPHTSAVMAMLRADGE
jgi:shikimate dehydrogenase